MARNPLSIGGARVLLVVGAVSMSLTGCVDGLTDNPLTDSEVSAFLTGATEVSAAADEASLAVASQTASLQRDAIVLSRASLDAAERLARAKADAETTAQDLRRRTDAVRASATADELSEIATARAAYDKAMKGTSVEELKKALSAYTLAVVTAETHVAARQAAATEGTEHEAPGQVPAAPQDRPAAGQPGGVEGETQFFGPPAGGGTSPVPPADGGAPPAPPEEPHADPPAESPADPVVVDPLQDPGEGGEGTTP
ncbi:hypothetical protein [Actinomyces respiraculi]|uniref:hypothetical protein n=1 Tax=Actinomyces respiraculi TaxID=2744574 RepID=UPI00141E24FF|nr:hypothetical protein [Actinomyces respiraculi]